MENWKDHWRGDLIDRLEFMRDYANSVYAAYFNYAIQHNISYDDEEHFIIRNKEIVNQIASREVYDCKSLAEYDVLEKRLDALLRELIEY